VIGAFGGSGFYEFLEGAEEVELETLAPWARMARFGVRSGSLPFAFSDGKCCKPVV
jgi:hypothetical protein